MTTEGRMELGTKFKGEMNCCQAVIKAFADTVDVDESTLMRLASGFGSGMGTMEGTCGTLVGAIMIASLRSGNAPAAAREGSAASGSFCAEAKPKQDHQARSQHNELFTHGFLPLICCPPVRPASGSRTCPSPAAGLR